MISPAQGLALTRIGFGLYFVAQALDKTTKNWLGDGGPLTQYIQPVLPRSEDFYRPFLEGTVLPNALLFSQLVTIGEWVAGLSLTLGLLTRLGALTGMWLVLNYMMMKGLPSVAGSSDRLFLLSCLVFLLTSAGLVWGLDGLLQRPLARTPLGGWLVGATRTRTGVAAP
jgi:thiosulfate dehydrogenase (quinone) large subunit